jgi:RNA polymerase sigma factor (sigma-70 family)
MNDAQWLSEFVKSRSESAFRQVVEHHLPMVLGTARRITGNNALAEEIAQAVFILLARKASQLRSSTLLGGWLYRTTRFVAARALTSEQRRKRREEEAARMHTDDDPVWIALIPQLDDAMARLAEGDRNTLVLRFLQQQTMRDVGIALGISEEAAKKRVARALEKLRGIFKRRGVEVGAGTLAAGMGRESARAEALSSLAAAITSSALAPAGGGIGAALAAEALAAWKWTQVKFGLAGAVALIGVSLLVPLIRERLASVRPETGDGAPSMAEAVPASSETEQHQSSGRLTDLPLDCPLREVTITVLDANTGEPIAGAELISQLPFTLKGAPIGSDRTGRDGIGTVVVPAPIPELAKLYSFGITVRAPAYAPREIHWLQPAGNVLSIVSPAYTVRLEPGITLSGVVVDEHGEPLRGVRLGVFGSNYRGYRSSTRDGGKPVYDPERREEDFAIFSMSLEEPTTAAIITDVAGRFSIPHFPGDLRRAILEFADADGSRRKFKTHGSDTLTAEQLPSVSFDELSSGTARIVFTRGVSIEGMVVDAEGFPVPWAEILEATHWGNLKIQSRVYSDVQGRFELPERQAREMILAASAPGHGSVSQIVVVEPGMAEVTLALPKESPLRGRVISKESGEPLPGAHVALVDYRNPGLGFEFATRTDAEGRFVWRGAPTNELVFFIAAPPASRRFVRLAVSEAEHIVELRADSGGTVHISGKVTDARTGKAVPEFEARLDMQQPSRQAKPNRFSNGHFTLALTPTDFSPGSEPDWSLVVEADGYELFTSRRHYLEEGDQQFEIQLQPMRKLEITIWTPEGSPAAQAQAAWVPLERSLFLNDPMRLGTSGGEAVTADVEGRMRLPRVSGARKLAMVHESGWAIIDALESLQPGLNLHLREWGRIEGTAWRGGQPLTGTRIGLSSAAYTVGGWSDSILISFSAVTDADGRFVFERVPAGHPCIVAVQAAEWQRSGHPFVNAMQTFVAVGSGETKQVRLESSGASVRVRLTLPTDSAAVQWTNVLAVLKAEVGLPRPLSRDHFVTDESYQEARRRRYTQQRTWDAVARARHYVAEVTERGELHFADVPPGEYLLEATLFEAMPARWELRATHKLSAAVRVPPAADGPVNLGAFLLERLP